MFSGIIKNTAKAAEIRKDKNSTRLYFSIPKGWKLEVGESINIDGICSTVEAIKGTRFQVYYMPETLRKTSLNSLTKTHVFNLERCLTLNDLISGHLVYGHVDGTAVVKKIVNEQDSALYYFELPESLTRYMVYKGSVSVNGVSLTIVSVDKKSFSVSLIPYTKQHTNLGELKKGNVVNIEVDMMAKHLEKLIQRK